MEWLLENISLDKRAGFSPFSGQAECRLSKLRQR